MRMLLLVVALSCRNGEKGETNPPSGDTAGDSGSDTGPDSGDSSGDTGSPTDDTGDDTGLVDDTGDSGDDTGDSGDDTGGSDTTVPVDLDLESSASMKLLGCVEYGTWSGLSGHTIAVAPAGDMSGDGAPDLALGLPSGGTGDGEAYVVSRPTSGESPLCEANAVLTSTADDSAGASVAGASDVDADGYDDLLIGAPSYDTYDGRAYVVTGPVSGTVDLETQATAIMQGVQGDDVWFMSWTGGAVSAAGDINGDSAADVLVGAPFYNSGATGAESGRVYVLNGPLTGNLDLHRDSTAIIEADATSGHLGLSLDGVGDIDGDGLSGFLVGTDGQGAFLFEGPVSGTIDAADATAWILDGDSGDYGGLARGVGDVDGDGYLDIAMAWGGGSLNTVRLVPGPIVGVVDLDLAPATLVAESSSDYFGFDLDGAGDVNADGFDDIAVGAIGPWKYETGYSAGMVYVVLGPVTGTVTMDHADYRLFGDGADAAGHTIAGVGDVDSDGLDDLLIGGPGDTDSGVDAGAAWLVLGASL